MQVINSGVEGANEIFVFDAGRIVERGPHSELVEIGGPTPASTAAGLATFGSEP
jgi:hypothetical protein